MANILLQDSEGKVVAYDETLHKDTVITQITETDIWPDLPQCQATAVEIFTSLAEIELEDYTKNPIKLTEMIWALVQFAPIDIKAKAEEHFVEMLADGRAHFTTQEELNASIVPESEMTEEDSRHPKQIARRAALMQ